MTTHPSQNVRFALIAVLFIILAAATTAAAGAQAGVAAGGPPASPAGGGPVAGGPFFAPISGLEFKPYYSNSSYTYSAGVCLKNTGSLADWFVAPVHVPNGITFAKMVVYYTDQDANKDLVVELLQSPLFGTNAYVLATFTSSGSLTGQIYGETTDIPAPQVDLSTGAYLVKVTLPASANVTLCGVRIDYGYAFQASLPMVRKQ